MRATGHLQVVGAAGRRRYIALWRDADGRHKKLLGPAHVRDSGRRTARGARIWRAGDGPKLHPSYLTPREAGDRLAEILAAAPAAVPAGPRFTPTFSEACAEWLRYVEFDRERTESTLRDYCHTVRRHLLPHFGDDTPVGKITTEDIDAFREQLLAGHLSRRSIQKILVILHGIFKRAKRRKWIAANPAEDAERVTFTRSGDFSVLTPAEVEALGRAAANDQDAAIFLTAAFTGLRLGELRGLRWRDVNFANRIVHVRRNVPAHATERVPKSGKVRSVPLVDRAGQVLDDLSRRELWTQPDDFVFPNALGAPFDDNRLRTRFREARDSAGIEPLRFHDLRHTFGTLAVRVFPLTDVKAFMGHADIQTTMLYVHHVPQHDAADKLSAALSAEVSPGPGFSATTA
ncbi:MAG TPA: site-specific integrase [Candidatus Limnocylindria bacterium]|nr:site-specific integrase [Candidatus Limnocylindria bacterium]